MVSSIAVFAAAATLCAASPQQCALDDLGECRVEAPPAARDHLLMQLGASGGAAPGRTRAPAALAAVSKASQHDTKEQTDDAAFEGALEKLVTKAKELMVNEVDVAGGQGQKAKIDEIVRQLQLDVRFQVSAKNDVQRDLKTIRYAIRKVSDSMEADVSTAGGFDMTDTDFERILKKHITGENANTIGAYEGDMVTGAQTAKTWPLFKPIHFCFASDIDRTIMEVFLQATAEYERLIPCITFKEVKHKSGMSTDPNGDKKCEGKQNAIFVQSKEGDGCHSEVGVMMEPATIINLMPGGCAMLGTVLHELGHALGVGHEQSRADRDEHIEVETEDIDKELQKNFETDVDMPVSGKYDIYSIFHAPEDWFHKNGAKGKDAETIRLKGTSLQKAFGQRIGQRMGLTEEDAKMVRKLYGCGQMGMGIEPLECKQEERCWKSTFGMNWASQEFFDDNTDYEYAEIKDGCVCHAHNQAVFKETRDGGCHRCEPMCPSDNTCRVGVCRCPPGLIRREMESAGGEACYQCSVNEPTGTVKDATEMNSEVEKLLERMPPLEMKEYREAIEGFFKDTLKVTIERKLGSIKVTTDGKVTPEDKNGPSNLREGKW